MRKENGFTLVELVIGLAIAAIILTVGIPSFNDLVRNNQMTTQANELIGALNLARSEAIKRGSSVSITAASGDSNWKDGWSVADGGETIRVYAAQKGEHTLVSDGGDSTYSYDPQGFINNNDTISLCLDSGATGRRITIAASGHAHVDGSYVCP
jgi:type IV fimbrial biogenesis protein FimT